MPHTVWREESSIEIRAMYPRRAILIYIFLNDGDLHAIRQSLALSVYSYIDFSRLGAQVPKRAIAFAIQSRNEIYILVAKRGESFRRDQS